MRALGARVRPRRCATSASSASTTRAPWRSGASASVTLGRSLVPLGFDERFRRMWEYYLSYCEAGFRTGNIDVRQMVFAKEECRLRDGGPPAGVRLAAPGACGAARAVL